MYKGQAALSSYITHGTFMAWLAFWLLHEARRRGRLWPWVGVILSSINVFLIVTSATGSVLLLVGVNLFLWQVLSVRRAVWGSLGLLLVMSLFFVGSKNFRSLVQSNFGEWQRAHKDVPGTGGIDQRLEFWRNTSDIIKEAPFLGHGMGSYSARYNRLVAGTNFTSTSNPHNEYLMLWAQAGLPAVVLLFLIFIWQWRQAAGPERWLGQGFVVLFGLGCAFNSFILDSREGILFALMTAVLYPAPVRGGEWRTTQKSHES